MQYFLSRLVFLVAEIWSGAKRVGFGIAAVAFSVTASGSSPAQPARARVERSSAGTRWRWSFTSVGSYIDAPRHTPYHSARCRFRGETVMWDGVVHGMMRAHWICGRPCWAPRSSRETGCTAWHRSCLVPMYALVPHLWLAPPPARIAVRMWRRGRRNRRRGGRGQGAAEGSRSGCDVQLL